ncbi:MAG: transcriptional repressor [Elusimicrobiota bacterium]|nr:transcriptional repressor [Elusimicrobiota bacterium]
MNNINELAKEIFLKYTQDKNLRDTKQREEILDTFLRIDKHLTADELYETVKRKYLKIGFATVYRTLRLMCECDLASEIKIGSGKARYEHKFGHEHHDHLICMRCGKFIEIKSAEIEKLQDKLAKANNFLSKRHKLEIYGLCRNCK